MKNRFFLTVVLPVFAGAVILGGCPPKKKLPIEEKKVEEPKPEEKPEEKAEAPSAPDIQINQDWSEIPNLELVHFGYDKANLDDEARSILKKNVNILKQLPTSVTVRVEGHCDERGTIEYNIALGERRANAVKSYYAAAGLSRSRIETISYGEERPLCKETTDDCYAQNRRAVTKVRNPEKITIKSSSIQ